MPHSKLHACTRAALAAALASAVVVAGCALPLPERPVHQQTFDLGSAPGTANAIRQQQGAVLAFADVRTPAALDTRHMIYRLAYAGEAQQPRPYALAAWSMPPAQLLRQRLENALAPSHPIVDNTSSLPRIELQLDLDTFEQIFRGAQASDGVVRVRVTAVAAGGGMYRLLGQRLFSATVPAPSADAAGGAAALRDATDEVVGQTVTWIATLPDTR